MPCYEVAIEARKNDTAEKCVFSAWIRGENTPKAVEEALQKVAYEHPDFGMLRPVCVEEQKLVAAYWQGTSAPRRQWKIVHKYKVEYRSPVSNRELLKKSYVWAVSAEEAVGYAKENVGISGLIVNAEESNDLIREIFFSPMVVDAAGIILIVAALPMVGWSWAVSHMAGPKVKNAKEGT